mmetsp:Transcript_86494/g.242144  ORF Transcript_86494/g.242144 Transcript_86494/m.242144 type:complete len:143 (-) Transcript_86494:72-500(-)
MLHLVCRPTGPSCLRPLRRTVGRFVTPPTSFGPTLISCWRRRSAINAGPLANAVCRKMQLFAAGFLACVERHRVADLQAGETNADMLYDQRIVTRVAVGCLGFHGYSHHQHDVMSGRGDVRTLRYASKTLLEDKQFMAAASP